MHWTTISLLVLLVSLSIIGCNPEVKNDELVGVWINLDEGCEIQLNRDFTFKSENLPLDVENGYYLYFSKEITTWRGVWSLKGEKLKLTINDKSYYYLEVDNLLTLGEPSLRVKLTDESGSMIYLEKREVNSTIQ